MMQNIAKSQHPIAKKWQTIGCFLLMSMFGYFAHFMVVGAYTFSGNAFFYAYLGFFIDIFYLFVALSTYGQFLGQKGGKYVAGIVIGSVGIVNIVILMILTLISRGKD
mmetsp:Transcript_28767/g.25464  ORF Transcript_28767/g.25464 Transcript_28767/m.25464 type:complete len:108 (-) Transcript_28767:499-822(-)